MTKVLRIMHRRVIMCYYIQQQRLSPKFLDQLWILNKLVKINDMFSLPQFYTILSHNLLLYASPKLGKLLALFPVLYNLGGTCIILIIIGGRTMDLIFKTLCDRDAMCHAKSLTNTEWFLVFTCLAILIPQLPNLNSIAWVSLIGAITVVLYSTLIWAL